MGQLVISQNVTLDGVAQDPTGEEGFRFGGWFTKISAADREAWAKVEYSEAVKADDWNDYKIRCQGKRIQLWINGRQTVDYTEPDDAIEQRGLIERIPNRGAIVARLTAKQVIDLYETREVLEGLAVRLSTQNTKPDHWDDLIVAFGNPAEQAIKNGDFEEYATILNVFRREVIATCNNLLLASLLDSMLERTAVVVRRMIMVPGRALEGLNDHRAVLAAMKAGKADEAERLKRSNIRAARHVFERYQQFVL